MPITVTVKVPVPTMKSLSGSERIVDPVEVLQDQLFFAVSGITCFLFVHDHRLDES